MSREMERGQQYLAGESMLFAAVDAVWTQLRDSGEIAVARSVLSRLRKGEGLLDGLPATARIRRTLCQQEALLTSMDDELSAAIRHDQALQILAELDIDDLSANQDVETLGIAGGICKRKWIDLGQLKDLIRAGQYYARGAQGSLGDDAYAQINAAFIDDLLAEAGEETALHHDRAAKIRERIVAELPASKTWWNVATRAEALFGLKRYKEATEVLTSCTASHPLWLLQTTARQIAALARIHEEHPLENPEIRAFFEALLPGAGQAISSVMTGKVGLALSGGGFRASFYHLGVLARLAELNVLRHVEVLSCVSGGSIVGASYWLALRKRLIGLQPGQQLDYVEVVKELIASFLASVATDVRGAVQPGKTRIAWRFLTGDKGALDPEPTAGVFDEKFYGPLMPANGPIYMHDLPFSPGDHDRQLTGSEQFHPGKHNWLRTDKVPALVLNATTVNTGHAWQFTPTWMGESPWAVHEEADTIPRLQWSWYAPSAKWQMELGRAVAASACVPMVFKPLVIEGVYENVEVQLVDGGVHDNQGTVSLLAMNCNVVLVSDACGQLLFEPAPAPGLAGLASYASRSMDTLMERVRLANFADLAARRRSGLLRGLMFLHMKSGLDANTIRLPFSSETYELHRALLSPYGIRKEFQQALAELRTDLDAFTEEESHALMACGYQMAAKAFERDLSALTELWEEPRPVNWIFRKMLAEITSTAAATPDRDRLLQSFKVGSKVHV